MTFKEGFYLLCVGMFGFIVWRYFIQFNAKRIVVLSKRIMWFPGILSILLGIFKILYQPSYTPQLLFGFISEYIFLGICILTMGIIQVQGTLIFEPKGIFINDLFTSRIAYNQISDYSLTRDLFVFRYKDVTYQYKLFPISEDKVKLIKTKLADYSQLQNEANNPTQGDIKSDPSASLEV